MVAGTATAGSTNLVLHLLAIAREAGIGPDQIKLDLFDGWRDPFPDLATDNARMGVAFLAAPLGKDRLADVDPAALEPERFAIGPGRTEIYLWYANGMARSKLAAMVLPDRRLGVSPTVRNWNTVTKLLELSGG